MSIDTRKPAVARAAVAAGATLLNDVGAANGAVAAELGVAWAAMHMQGEPAHDAGRPALRRRRRRGARRPRRSGPRPPLAAGVPEVWIDPGIGFGKTHAHNLALLAHLDALRRHRATRCSWARAARGSSVALLGDSDGTEAPAALDDRLEGSLATATWAMANGARMVRVHDVRATAHAALVIGGQISEGRSMRGTMPVPMKGKWAQGIQPRNFAWILKDRLAVCERPGGYGANHRRVRRQEEIIWIREQGFTCVVTLIPSPHNLHNYDELGVPGATCPSARTRSRSRCCQTLFPELADMLAAPGGKVLVHQDELSDRVAGLMAGYLLWSEVVPEAPQATSVVERLLVTADGSARARPRRPRRHRPQVAAWPPATSSSCAACGWPASSACCPTSRPRPSRSRSTSTCTSTSARPAGATTSHDTVDYGAVCDVAERVVTSTSYALLEALAEHLADRRARGRRADRGGHRRGAEAAAAGRPAAEHVRRPHHPGTLMPRAFLGLGSNLGDRAATSGRAVAALPDLVAVSPVYETDPVGGPGDRGRT